jgi:hypothetical protein
MDDGIHRHIVAGARVRVTQQIAARHYAWASAVEGVVVDYSQKETGSWFAHSKDDRLWLDRLVIRKDDGEITTLILDDYSKVQVLSAASSGESGKKNESDLPV